jgi:hypothetical protein
MTSWQSRLYVTRHDTALEALWLRHGIRYTGFGVTEDGDCWYHVRYDRRAEAETLYREWLEGQKEPSLWERLWGRK